MQVVARLSEDWRGFICLTVGIVDLQFGILGEVGVTSGRPLRHRAPPTLNSEERQSALGSLSSRRKQATIPRLSPVVPRWISDLSS